MENHNDIVPASLGNGTLMIGSRSFKTTKWVTRTVLRQETDTPFYVQIESPIHLSTMDPENSKFKDAKTGEGAIPEVFDVINLETGEYQVVIANTVLASELRRAYPDDGYVGRKFGIMQTRSDVDKRYKAYKIIEIELSSAPGGAEPVRNIDAATPEAIDRVKKNSKAA